MQLVPLTPQRHGHMFWKRFTSYGFASRVHLAPLIAAELIRAVQSIPMAFVKRDDRYLMVGMLSPAPGENLYVNPSGQWIGPYVPSVFRSHPFRLVRQPGQEDLTLCVDEDAGLLTETPPGESLFNEKGKLSASVVSVLMFLENIEKDRFVTEQAVAELDNAGVIGEWPLSVRDGDTEKMLDGLFKVDASRLHALTDETLLKLRKTRALYVAYAQLLSMYNLRVFAKLRKTVDLSPETHADGLQALFTDDGMLKI